jgi:hypothetical protein
MAASSAAVAVPFPIGPDLVLLELASWWQSQPSATSRIGLVLRHSFDEVLDGQRTGRYLYEDLAATERNYVGAKVEIVLREEFDLQRGPAPKHLSLTISGHAVAFGFADGANWTIPPAVVDELCLLVTASDQTSTFSFGLMRCYERFLAASTSGDRPLNTEGRDAVHWLWQGEPMPVNFLRSLPPPTVQAIMASPGSGSGQTRINELFRRVHRQVISREVVLTVAQQDDPMKRPRDARHHLQPEGIIILGHQNAHPKIAEALGLPVPHKGEYVATRLVPATPARLAAHRAQVIIEGSTWVEAQPGDPVEPGPAGNY